VFILTYIHAYKNTHHHNSITQGLVVRALEEAEALLDEIAMETDGKEEVTDTLCSAVHELHAVLHNEAAALHRCHGSLAAVASLETLERSLAIQRVQCS
jgi:hypothetical protein